MEFVGKALQLKEAKQVFASDPKILIECAQLAVNSVMNILDLEIEVAGSTLYSLELFHLFAIACGYSLVLWQDETTPHFKPVHNNGYVLYLQLAKPFSSMAVPNSIYVVCLEVKYWSFKKMYVIINQEPEKQIFAGTAILTMPHVPVTAWFTRKQKVMRLMRKHSKAVFPNRDDWQSDRPFESVQEFLDLYKATDCLSQKLNVIQVLCMCYWAIELIFRQRGGHLSQVDVVSPLHFSAACLPLIQALHSFSIVKGTGDW